MVTGGSEGATDESVADGDDDGVDMVEFKCSNTVK